jgi:predicted thioesterase
MRHTLATGTTTTVRLKVDRTRTISFMGEEFRVYATPSMILDIEDTCKDFLQRHLEDGESSVGVRVEMDHLGPTLVGMWVDIAAAIAEVEGRRVTFDVDVHDEAGDHVGHCRHVRFIVDLARQRERLAAKRVRVSG